WDSYDLLRAFRVRAADDRRAIGRCLADALEEICSVQFSRCNPLGMHNLRCRLLLRTTLECPDFSAPHGGCTDCVFNCGGCVCSVAEASPQQSRRRLKKAAFVGLVLTSGGEARCG